MKNKVLLTFFIFLSLHSLAQIRYEKGYFIDNDGKKTDCFIRNVDWKDNPKFFDYKLTENGKSETAYTVNIKEFSVENESVFKRFITEWDVSSNTINDISDVRQPIMKKDTLFLRQLVEGKADLYLFEIGDIKRYFFTVDTITNPTQLIYKRYKTTQVLNGRSYVAENNTYIAQLQQFIRCKDAPLTSFNNSKYTKNSLISVFDKYNKCNNTSKIKSVILPTAKRKILDISAKFGIYNSSVRTVDASNIGSVTTNFDKQTASRIGLDLEYYLPFNKNKWSVIIEPTYSYFTGEKKKSFNDYLSLNTKIKYQFLSVSLGIRHQFFINKDNTIFVNAYWVWNKPVNNSAVTVDYRSYGYPNTIVYKLNNSNSVALGLGYRYKRASVEGRYFATREVIKDSNISAQFKSLGITFGYRLFSK